jgi:hypothetical protein
MEEIEETRRQLQIDIKELAKKERVVKWREQLAALDKKFQREVDLFRVEKADERDLEQVDAKIDLVTDEALTATAQLLKKVVAMKVQQERVARLGTNVEEGETTKQLMLDFADEYNAKYAVAWLKALVALPLFYFLYSSQNALLFLVLYCLMVLVWYVVAFVKYLNDKRQLGKDIVGKTCADMPDGCCPDGVTAMTDASGSNCVQVAAPLCSATAYGCCPDGVTTRIDVASCQNWCADTDFGCCPGGLEAKIDPSGSNCSQTED